MFTPNLRKKAKANIKASKDKQMGRIKIPLLFFSPRETRKNYLPFASLLNHDGGNSDLFRAPQFFGGSAKLIYISADTSAFS